VVEWYELGNFHPFISPLPSFNSSLNDLFIS
jgi:hypothetical protein